MSARQAAVPRVAGATTADPDVAGATTADPDVAGATTADPDVTGATTADPDVTGATTAARPGGGSGIVVGPDGLPRPAWAATDPLMREYYDTEWGVPVSGERAVFERLSLEAFQAGLSWATILRKRPAFRELFHDFDPDVVAAMTDADVERLMTEPRIIRNRAKIRATRTNARATLGLREDGGLEALVWSFRPETTPLPRTMEEVPSTTPESVALSKELRRRGFAFVGPTTMHALMEAIGIVDTHLVGSHRRGVSGLWKPDGTRA